MANPLWRPHAPAKTRGAIAAGHPKTAEAGLEMFRLGGNAFDAVAAAVMASFVTEPALTSIAGGGFLLAHTHSQRNILFDFFTQTPRQKRPRNEVDFYPVQVDFGTATQEFHIGLGSMAVPGTIGGIWHVQQKLGRLPFATTVEPAIHLAKTGVEVNKFQAYCFSILEPILLNQAAGRAVYAPTGTLLKQGDRLVMPDLADTLSYLAKEGARGFYEGDIAKQLVNDCANQGGYLTLEDLQHYQVIERQPLQTQYRGETFLTNPPPSSGGALIAFSLALMSSLELRSLRFGSVEHRCCLAEVMRLTNQARTDGFDHNLYDSAIAQTFLSNDHVQHYQRELQAAYGRGVINKWGSTTHVSAIDNEGNAASVTSSNGEGSGYMIPGTGIMVNNMLGEADLHPHGFHEWQPDLRISSMMSPTMLLRDSRPELVLGSGGSNRIRTAILQVISNCLDFQMDVETAVRSPRIHWENGVFSAEPGLEFPAESRRSPFPFNGTVKQWQQQNMFFGGVHAVTRHGIEDFAGAGDRRRGGAVAISPEEESR